ncbi:MAG: universal stress protein [Lautropia sp.]
MYQRILVPVDGSEPSRQALDEALRLARRVGDRPVVQLQVLHVLDDALDQTELVGHGNAVLAEAIEQGAAVAVTVSPLMKPAIDGSIAAAVLAEALAGGVDLIVIGTHGRRGLGRAVLGSVAEEVIRDSPVPVLLPGRRR